MTENKRFEVIMNEFDEVEYIMDKVAMEDRDFAEFIDFVEDICKENEQLKQENQGIQDKVMRLLDYVEIKQCVTRTEIKKWWNGDE
jgi:FtsZ-binding cell division protein ZapB